MHTLVLGGARSGKSRYAVQCAIESGKAVVFIATANADDAEMQARILQHQADRPQHWRTVEEPLHLAAALVAASTPDNFLLVDCLTLWLNNILFDKEGRLQQDLYRSESQLLLAGLSELPGSVMMVSNEVGQGVVPLGKSTRRFVDEAGRLHQNLARICSKVVLVTAGLARQLK